MIDYGKIRRLVADGLRAQVAAAAAVHDHEPGDLGAASPILIVRRRGRGRDRLTARGGQTRVRLTIDAYYLASEAHDGTYTYADAADVVDAVATQIDAWIDANQTSAAGRWEAIAYDGDTTIEVGVFGADGIPRIRESLDLTLTCFA